MSPKRHPSNSQSGAPIDKFLSSLNSSRLVNAGQMLKSVLLALVGVGVSCVPALAQQSVMASPGQSYGVPADSYAASAQSYIGQANSSPGSNVYSGVVSNGCQSCQGSTVAPCDCQAASPCAGSRCGGDPWTLFNRNNDQPRLNIGGWIQAGHHADGNGLFNNHPSDFNIHQAYLFVEKAAVSENGNLGFGWRFDGLYGLDAADTQSFGNTGATFDLDPRFTRNGGFGWAIPQLYGEVAKGDWNVKIGHFYTLIGYEVVTAPDNFFYSHAITQFNSEPFTHTGVLAGKQVNDNTTVYGGWTAGWDSGFDFGAGSNFLGGVSRQLSEDVSLAYMTTFGNFGNRSANNSDGYSHSIVLDMQMTQNLNTVIQSDLTRIASTGEDSVGLVLYNFYQINDCLSFGSRNEWWKGDDIIGYDYGGRSAAPVSSTSYFANTIGLNYKVNPNIIVRPEFRRDWSPALDYQENYFGFDVIATF